MASDDAQSTTTADGGRRPDGRTAADGGAPPDDGTHERVVELRARVNELETELERERRRRRTVIEQYERLLDDRRPARDDGDEGEVWDGDIFALLLD